MITLKNTMSGLVEDFVPIDPTNIRMYVCGPTVYDRAHLGNARPALVFDTLYRLLRQVYGPEAVTYVRNFTDVDDKINARAAKSNQPIEEITRETIRWYLEDMREMNVLDPDHMPRATEYIFKIQAMVQTLIEKRHAYMVDGHVFFSVSSAPDYGRLSGRSLNDMRAGARVEVSDLKQDPMDFVLWKPSTGTEHGWPSPWGYGRPGWHIECSAMSADLLGETFDIHGGGGDLVFPHHENEIAQSRCAHGTSQVASVWMHNEMLQVNGSKMAKSSGNFFTVRDLIQKGHSGEEIRMVMLWSHYTKPMDWTDLRAKEAGKALRRWKRLTTGVVPGRVDGEFLRILSVNLNTPGAISRLFELERQKELPALKASAALLGLLQDEELHTIDYSAHEGALRRLRARAMETGDFSLADDLRRQILMAGAEVHIRGDVVEIRAGSSHDPARMPLLKPQET